MGGRILSGLAAAVVFAVSAGAQSKTAAKPASGHDSRRGGTNSLRRRADRKRGAISRPRAARWRRICPTTPSASVKEITGSLLVEPERHRRARQLQDHRHAHEPEERQGPSRRLRAAPHARDGQVPDGRAGADGVPRPHDEADVRRRRRSTCWPISRSTASRVRRPGR